MDPKITHLSSVELKALEEKAITIRSLAMVRDMFIFSCYTGFAYVDVANLTTTLLKNGIDGRKRLIKSRQKTIWERVPLLPPDLRILQQYIDRSKSNNNGRLLPIPLNRKVNAYLKDLADICGITTPLTFHVARYTFA